MPAGNARYQQPNSDIQDPMGNLNSNLEKDDEGRILVYTDGTACNPDDHRRRRAAWATYYAHEHPWNCSGPVEGGLQTVYRAEPEVVHHVISFANQPTHIVADCLSMVHKLQDILADDADEGHERGGPCRPMALDKRKNRE